MFELDSVFSPFSFTWAICILSLSLSRATLDSVINGRGDFKLWSTNDVGQAPSACRKFNFVTCFVAAWFFVLSIEVLEIAKQRQNRRWSAEIRRREINELKFYHLWFVAGVHTLIITSTGVSDERKIQNAILALAPHTASDGMDSSPRRTIEQKLKISEYSSFSTFRVDQFRYT